MLLADDILGEFDPWDGRQMVRLTRRAPWSPKMIYRIVTYDKTTERMKGSLPISASVFEDIKRIAGVAPKDDGLGEYPLDEGQTRQVARILDFDPEPDRFYYYVEPYEPPEDDGLQRIAKAVR